MRGWIKIEDALPKHGQAVLVRRNQDNWHLDHLLGDQKATIWRWVACYFVEGRSREDVDKAGYYRSEDQFGNNLKPYCWEEFGPGKLFGQDVSHWMPIEAP